VADARRRAPSFAEAVRALRTSSLRSDRLGEPLNEVERRLGDLAPAVVDRKGVASVRDRWLTPGKRFRSRGRQCAHDHMPVTAYAKVSVRVIE
jgi:hypothetical protein